MQMLADSPTCPEKQLELHHLSAEPQTTLASPELYPETLQSGCGAKIPENAGLGAENRGGGATPIPPELYLG